MTNWSEVTGGSTEEGLPEPRRRVGENESENVPTKPKTKGSVEMAAKEQVRAVLSTTPISVDMLTDVTGLGRNTVRKSLTDLGREGVVDNAGDGRWALTSKYEVERLPSGGLRSMVLAYLEQQQGVDASPHTIGKAIGRSAGAVANACEKLAHEGVLVQTSKKPRQYRYGK